MMIKKMYHANSLKNLLIPHVGFKDKNKDVNESKIQTSRTNQMPSKPNQSAIN